MNKHINSQNDEISLKEIINLIKRWFRSLLTQWWKISIVGIIGGAIGITYAYFKPITYTAKLSFLVEEGKSGGGGLASLAGQFGFDIGGLAGGSGLLSGDNILVFLKSKSLARETLLTPYDTLGKFSLADRYADVNGLRKTWKANKEVGEVYFPVDMNHLYTRLQDSLLHVIVERILEKELLIDKPDKKASFVQVTTDMKDELLAKYFCERLVKKATDRYVNSKTSRQAVNVNKLQRRADSIGALLNNKTFVTAIAQEKLLDVNPAFKSSTVHAEVTSRDKLMLTTIYGEVIKNLEISKVALSQETPAIQVIDNVELPLKINKIGKFLSFFVGAFATGFAFIIFWTLNLILRSKL